MSNVNIFEQASRAKLRFATVHGSATVEDLWELPLTSPRGANLNDIAIALHRKVKEEGEVLSFVDPAQKRDDTAQLAFDVVKHIIDIRVAERDAAAAASTRAEHKQRLLALLQSKELEEMSKLSMDDLRKQIQEL